MGEEPDGDYEDDDDEVKPKKKTAPSKIWVTLPAGTELIVDRIYIRKCASNYSLTDSKEFSSVTFLIKEGKYKSRFFVSREEANKIKFKFKGEQKTIKWGKFTTTRQPKVGEQKTYYEAYDDDYSSRRGYYRGNDLTTKDQLRLYPFYMDKTQKQQKDIFNAWVDKEKRFQITLNILGEKITEEKAKEIIRNRILRDNSYIYREINESDKQYKERIGKEANKAIKEFLARKNHELIGIEEAREYVLEDLKGAYQETFKSFSTLKKKVEVLINS